MKIVPDDLSGEAIQALLAEHLSEMRSVSPPGAAFALDLERPRSQAVGLFQYRSQ